MVAHRTIRTGIGHRAITIIYEDDDPRAPNPPQDDRDEAIVSAGSLRPAPAMVIVNQGHFNIVEESA